MFKKELQKKLEGIFGLGKTTFNDPSDKFEQDTLFITIAQVRSNAGKGSITAEVRGYVTVYAQTDKFPYGFFNKRIALASAELTKGLFFYDIDVDVVASEARLVNIGEHRTSFVYFYKAQYDPNQGSLTEVDFCNEGEN